MINKFKVGDLVSGNELSDKLYARTNSQMKKAIVIGLNRPHFSDTIQVEILEHSNPHYVGHRYYVVPEVLDFYDKPDNIVIFRNSKATVCEINSNGNRIAKGLALCHPDDNYSFVEGAKIALSRAKEQLIA